MQYVHFKVEDHTQLSSVKANSLENLIAIVNLGHLSNRKSIILLQNLANILKVFMQSRSTGVVSSTVLPDQLWVGDWGIGEVRMLANEIDHIHAEAINPFVEPISYDVLDSCPYGRVVPI